MPCVFYCCGSGVDGVTGNFGCFYSRVPCGGKRFCRSMCGSFANRDDLIQRLLSGLMGLELRRSDLSISALLTDPLEAISGKQGRVPAPEIKMLVLSEMA